MPKGIICGQNWPITLVIDNSNSRVLQLLWYNYCNVWHELLDISISRVVDSTATVMIQVLPRLTWY